MRMYDIIMKKRNGGTLSKEEIHFMIDGYVKGEIPDYQMSAMTMAIYYQGMTDEEMTELTLAMAASGDQMDLSGIQGIKVDKHSTGGVGDKTTLVLAPIVAACGGRVAKISGRGLGHTGGTLDKLESIPGVSVAVEGDDFVRQVNEIGLAVIGQTGNLVPADKKLYALRDVTATVDSVPLIASSIMSKKLASGSDAIVLDVKTGSGAFMKETENSILLAQKMVAIGTLAGRRVVALITDMDTPLGHNVGNALEVQEAVATLQGCGPADLTEVCLTLATNMLVLSGKGSYEECMAMAKGAIADGSAFAKLKAMVAAQGGDSRVLDDLSLYGEADVMEELLAPEDGYVGHIDTEGCGIAAAMLGAGRETKEDTIDMLAGLYLAKKEGDEVKKGEVLARLYTCDGSKMAKAKEKLLSCYAFCEEKPVVMPLILAKVTKDGVERYDE